MVTCNPDISLIRMFFASQIQLHIPTDVPLICQFMASKGFVGDRLLTRQAKKKYGTIYNTFLKVLVLLLCLN